ncbi:hypothetical protein ACHAXR_006807 [Thalassiosira sp. AJA248-18]
MVSACSLLISCLASSTAVSSAFQSSRVLNVQSVRNIHPTTFLSSASSDAEEYLSANCPSYTSFLAKNGDAMKKAIKSEEGFTIFAPTEAAFASLDEKKKEQLEDVRNTEVTMKIASYHAIAEPVTADELFNSGGVVTVGGEVPADRSVSGGFFGVGGKEDGGVTLNGAKVVKSVEFTDDAVTGIIHEVDDFISPSILWRYADQRE